MARLGTVTFFGASGTAYAFNVYPFDSSFKEIGAVYVISRQYSDSESTPSPPAIYVGEMGDLSDRGFDQHHKYLCFQDENADCICIHRQDTKQNRLDIESDLIGHYDPPCNY